LNGKLRALSAVPDGLRRLAAAIGEQPALCRAVSAAARIALGFLLAGGSILGWPMPFAAALVAASDGMLPALGAMLGGGVGYLYFWGFTGGLEFLAVGMLAFSCVCIFREFPLARSAWFMPAAVAFMAALVGFLFLLQARFSPLRVCLFICRTALAGGAAAVFRRAAQTRAPGALLFSLFCLLSGLSSVTLAGGFTLGHLAAAAFAAAAAGTPAGMTVAAVCGLALDLSVRPVTSLCAVLCFAGLTCRAAARWPRPARILIFLLSVSGAVLAAGGRVPEFILAAAVGCCLSLLLPDGLAFGGASAAAQDARDSLAAAADTLGELSSLLAREEPDGGAAAEAARVFDRSSERVCRCCVLFSQCWQQKSLDTYHALCAVARPMMERGCAELEDFPQGFADNCRHLDALVGAVNHELDAQLGRRQLRRRLREGRAALTGQYGVLARYLRGTAARLSAPARRPAYRAELGIRSAGKAGCAISSDRGACFRTEDGRLFVLLCDGMGTGAEAAAEAAAAIRTLGGLLRAGLDPADALETLNGVYVLRDDGGFSTVDLLAADLVTGEAALYKWGAAPSYLLLDGAVKKLGTAAPPPGLGVGDTHKAEEIRLSLQRGELLVLLSDGAGGEDAGQRIAALEEAAPRELAAAIIAGTEADGSDDRTAVVVRLRPLSSRG